MNRSEVASNYRTIELHTYDNGNIYSPAFSIHCLDALKYISKPNNNTQENTKKAPKGGTVMPKDTRAHRDTPFNQT
jgi:hypothetical protein